MKSTISSQFSAAPSMSGYLFQCRYALLESLNRIREEEEFSLTIETLDDVVFETDEKALELIQTKHHINKAADLTDSSPDLWKTLRIWCEGLTSGNIPSGTIFLLVTTSKAARGSVAAYLKADKDRNVQKAIERLNSTAESSTSQTNEPGYSAYKSLSGNQRESLINSIYILDSMPTLDNLDSALRKEVHFAVESRFLDAFIERLEGWWLRRVIAHLTKNSDEPIFSRDIEDEMTQLREQFKLDNLPIDDDILDATIDASGYQDHTFVHQLKLIELGSQRILYAIHNYFRAFEQRSRWMREDLLLVGELDQYEEKLIREWGVRFERMKDNLSNYALEDEMRDAGRRIYEWVETDASIPIRRECNEPFITRGSYQMLADCRRVGWHPKFETRSFEMQEAIQ